MERDLREALAVAGMPDWASIEFPDCRETLAWVEAQEGRRACAIVVRGAEEESEVSDGPPDYLEISLDLAERILSDHLRRWLARRGWQVQLDAVRNEARWRLADAVSFADGGGDRLDAEYPSGSDELSVLCDSVVAVATACSTPMEIRTAAPAAQ